MCYPPSFRIATTSTSVNSPIGALNVREDIETGVCSRCICVDFVGYNLISDFFNEYKY